MCRSTTTRRVILSMWRHLLASDAGVGWRRVWRMLLVVIVLVTASGIIWLADARYDRACTTEQMSGRRAGVCGPRLVDMLRVVCRSVYNKRSADYANRRRERLRRLLAAIQSNVQRDNPLNQSLTTSAFASTTTPAADKHVVQEVSDDGRVGPFVTRGTAMSFTSTHRRRRRSVLRRGIVCECCVHRCDLDELQGYCGSPNN